MDIQPVYLLGGGGDLLGVGHCPVEIHIEISIICHDVESYGNVLDAFRHVNRHFYRLHTTVIGTHIDEFHHVSDVVRLVICRLIAYYRGGCEVAEIRQFGDIVDAIFGHLEYSRGVGDITGNGEI